MENTDHAIAITKAFVAGIPVIGGPLSSLLGDYIPKAAERSIKKFCNELEEEVKKLGDRINKDKINSDEMAELFQRAIHASVKTTRETKIKAAARVVTNGMLSPDDPDKISYTELDHFLNAVDALSEGALYVLGICYNIPPGKEIGALLNPGGPGEIQFNSGDLISRITDLEPSITNSLVAELDNWNLVRRGHATISTLDPSRKYITNNPIYLTQPGTRFVHYILQQS